MHHSEDENVVPIARRPNHTTLGNSTQALVKANSSYIRPLNEDGQAPQGQLIENISSNEGQQQAGAPGILDGQVDLDIDPVELGETGGPAEGSRAG